MPPSSPSSAAGSRYSLLSVAGIALTAFMVGLMVGSSFMGAKQAPSSVTMDDLPPGHPSVDSTTAMNAPPLRPDQMPGGSASTTGSGAATGSSAEASGDSHAAHSEGYDLNYDDPTERARIAALDSFPELVSIGNTHFDAGHPKLAILAYEKALKRNPSNPNVQTDLGVMYRVSHRHAEAVEAFRKAARLDRNHSQSRYNLGLVLLEDEKDQKGAIAAWEDYLRVAPNGDHAKRVRDQIARLKR